MAEEKKVEIKVQRNSVVINSSGTPKVCSAHESISWNGGVVQLVGIGATREEALVAVNVQFESLKKILGVL
jgi:hypothetical protein